MSANTMNHDTRNNDIGLYPSKSRIAYTGLIAADVEIGEVATWARVIVAGWIVFHNPFSDEDCIEYLEAGEKAPLIFDKIYFNKALDDQTTTAETLIWYSTPQVFKKPSNL